MKKYLRALSFGLALAAVAVLPGCFEISQHVTLNPDGSGKVTQSVVTAFGPGMLEGFGQGLGQERGDGDAPAAEDLAEGFKMGFSTAMMEQSEGIEAWAEPEMEALKDGRTRMTVTGYFRDITKVRLSTEMNIGGGTESADGDANEEAEASGNRPEPLLSVRRTDDGRMIIGFMKPADEASGEAREGSEAAPALSDDEIAAKIREERQSWQFAKAFMSGMLGGMKIQTSVEVPGTIESAVNVEKEGDNRGSLTITGQQILAVTEKILMDDELAAKALRQGGEIMDSLDSLDSDAEMMKLLFEDGRPPSLTVKIEDKPLFDYAAEVEKAKKEQAPTDADGDEGTEKTPKKSGNITASAAVLR